MARTLALREPAEEERTAWVRLAHSRTAAARLIKRARVVWAAAQGERVIGTWNTYGSRREG